MDWYVQEDDEVRRLSEKKLRKRLRKNDLSGLELARREDETEWQPLHDRSLFEEEVPFQGNRVDAARWRKVREFGVHAAIYVGVNALAGFPAPLMVIWGIFVVLQGSRTLAPFLALHREGKIPGLAPPGRHAALAAGEAERKLGDEPAAELPEGPRAAAAPTSAAALAHQPTVAAGANPPPSLTATSPGAVRPRARRASSDPSMIGRYRIAEKLGEGGMGVVYRGLDEILDRPVAIKLVATERNIDRGTRRLQREARAMARLSHPNVVTVLDVGELDDSVWVAMELIDGETLRDWLAAARPAADILEVLVQAARGIAAAHEKGLVHRDFKPENVMVGRDGRTRVLDFGLAKPTDSNDSLTRGGALLGTPRYMAPEQLRGEPADARSDQFALGVVFYEALYGTHPYEPEGDQAVTQAVLAGNLSAPPSRADVPEAVREAILRGLCTDAAARHDSVEAFVDALGPLPTTRDEIAQLAAAVRRMIARRSSAASRHLEDTIGEIERAIAELDAKAGLLARHLARARDADPGRTREAHKRPRAAGAGELAVAKAPSDAIPRARRSVDELRARRADVARKLEALHLDLVRAEAEDTALADLTGPLENLRIELDAAREVEELLR